MEAERRVLILENPALRGLSQISNTLYAGVQLLMPGEIAPAHRHTQSALRFILEGSGAYTAVDGEKTLMQRGDFVITPSWTWHHHGNGSDQPTIWLDGLDIPMVAFFNSTFREDHGSAEADVHRPMGDSPARFGQGLLPVGHIARSLNSPVFNYPYSRTREALATIASHDAPDPAHGHLMRYVNPIDGGWAMPTIAPTIRLLPNGIETTPYRSTDAKVFVVVEGGGTLHLGDQRLFFEESDVFVVPGWVSHHFSTTAETVLFAFSDRVVQEKIGIFREQR
jgi:gentisate 1,2-dioxygenase